MPHRDESELPVFVAWVGFLDWLLDATDKLPKKVRFTLASRIDTLALDVLEDLVEARYTRAKAEILRRANLRLEKLRVLLRLCHGRKLLAHGAYEHAARELDAVGRMVGGWLREREAQACR